MIKLSQFVYIQLGSIYHCLVLAYFVLRHMDRKPTTIHTLWNHVAAE